MQNYSNKSHLIDSLLFMLHQEALKNRVFLCTKDVVLFFEKRQLYRNNLKNREFGKEAPQNFDAERATIAEGQGASEHQNSEAKPTEPKPDSSGCFGIKKKEPQIVLKKPIYKEPIKLSPPSKAASPMQPKEKPSSPPLPLSKPMHKELQHPPEEMRTLITRFLPYLHLKDSPLIQKSALILYEEGDSEECLIFLQKLSQAIQKIPAPCTLLKTSSFDPSYLTEDSLLITFSSAFPSYHPVVLLPVQEYLAHPSLKKTLWNDLCQRLKG